MERDVPKVETNLIHQEENEVIEVKNVDQTDLTIDINDAIINKKIEVFLDTQEEHIRKILENKVNICLKKILEGKYQQLKLRLEKQVDSTLKDILDNKVQLPNEIIDNYEIDTPETNIKTKYVHSITKIYETEKEIANLHKNINGTEEKVMDIKVQIPNIGKMSRIRSSDVNPTGKYENWGAEHDKLRLQIYVSTVEVLDAIFKIKALNIESSVQRTEAIRLFNSWKIYKINRTIRFPVDETCINLRDPVISVYISRFYNLLKRQEYIENKREQAAFAEKSIYHQVQDLLKEFELRVFTPEVEDVIIEKPETERDLCLKSFSKLDVTGFESNFGLIWVFD